MLFCCFQSWAGLNKVTPTFWSVTLKPLGAEQATIPHLKEAILGFHMTPILKYVLVKLLCSGQIISLNEFALVNFIVPVTCNLLERA